MQPRNAGVRWFGQRWISTRTIHKVLPTNPRANTYPREAPPVLAATRRTAAPLPMADSRDLAASPSPPLEAAEAIPTRARAAQLPVAEVPRQAKQLLSAD